MEELEEWLKRLRQELEQRTGRKNIEVTGGPYRGYDVKVSKGKDGHPIVDFYSPIRLDAREGNALNYAVSMLKDWDATVAGYEAEERIVKPIFDRIQGEFPDIELSYSVGDFETHKVWVGEKEKGKLTGSFDLWPAMKEKDIARLINYIKEDREKVLAGTSMAGCDYWGEAE
jgi:hypothetical protein